MITLPSQLTVTAHGNQLATIADFVIAAARAAGLDERAVYHVETAVDEACANIIRHAYEFEGQGTIHLQCEIKQNHFVVTLTDHGRPFDPSAVTTPDVTAPLEERPEGGLGCYLMQCLMDEIRYQFTNNTNTLRMVKQI
jgi:anti-sigma regulatory factor (Ser/Thr protein kinase)